MTHPSPTATLVQLTDLHLVADGDEPPGGVDTAAVLEEALRALEEAAIRPAALVLTGDLTEHGRPAEYHRLRAIVEPAAARLGAAPVYVAGNHDDRAALREHLLDERPSAEPLDHVVRVGDLRVVVLDSTVPGHAHGELRPAQLERLRAELAAAVTDTDVRVVLAGHTHVVSAGALGGVPVWTGGPLAGSFDPLAPGAALRTLATPTASRVDLFPDALITTSIPVGARRLVEVPAARMEPALVDFRAAWASPIG